MTEDVWGPLIALFGALVTYVLIPYIKSKTTEAQQDNIRAWVEHVVWATEKVAERAKINKYEYAKRYIKQRFPNLTDDEINILIESSVKELDEAFSNF